MRLKLTIAYDGSHFSGWQSQPNNNTVQDHIADALAQVAKQPIAIHGSGRTDTGVHAEAQIAHFDTPPSTNMNPYNWVPALNTKLPPSIRIMHCEEVAADFHARFSATHKTYQYDLCLSPVLHPHLHGRVWHLPRQLDPISLEQALSHYLGTHDFRAFAANRGNETAATDYRRTLTRSDFHTIENGYRITFAADGFMYKMVRLLTGAAVQVAQGRVRLDDHLALLDQLHHLPHGKSPVDEVSNLISPDQTAHLPHGKSPLCAPPDGLTLLKVHY